jgi:hypothetical protein
VKHLFARSASRTYRDLCLSNFRHIGPDGEHGFFGVPSLIRSAYRMTCDRDSWSFDAYLETSKQGAATDEITELEEAELTTGQGKAYPGTVPIGG